ncbi:MAG: hypothetical protein WBX22_23160 [Silvibacterium sp.]
MNERQEFLRHFRSEFIKVVDRLDTMTKSEVLDGIAEVRAARAIYKEEITERIAEAIHAEPQEQPRAAHAKADTSDAMAHLGSIQVYFDSVNKLRWRAGGKMPPLGGPGFELLESALNERLESLRERPSSDS